MFKRLAFDARFLLESVRDLHDSHFSYPASPTDLTTYIDIVALSIDGFYVNSETRCDKEIDWMYTSYPTELVDTYLAKVDDMVGLLLTQLDRDVLNVPPLTIDVYSKTTFILTWN